jgi:hypothetical protein
MRTLLAIPIIHTEHDMGTLLEHIKREYVARFGQDKWQAHLKSIDDVWLGIRQMLSLLELPFVSVRLYQDGLPVCGKELEIVRDVAAQGSTNHQLLMELMAKGAKLEGTEDAGLLLQEYRFHQGQLRNTLPEQENQRAELSQKLLLDRDQFIAKRINSTLLVGEIGVLFLGLAHSIDSFLDTDILVRPLLPSLRPLPASWGA